MRLKFSKNVSVVSSLRCFISISTYVLFLFILLIMSEMPPKKKPRKQSSGETTTTKLQSALKTRIPLPRQERVPDMIRIFSRLKTGFNPSSSDLGLYVGVIQTIVHLFSILENVSDRCVLGFYIFLQITL